MSKFNIGDKVKVVKGYPLYNCRGESEVVGKTAHIKSTKQSPDHYGGRRTYKLVEDNGEWDWDDEALELLNKNKYRIVYKVVKADELVSIVASGKYEIHYKLFKKAKGINNSLLFAFKSIEDLMREHSIMIRGGEHVILKCLAKVSKAEPLRSVIFKTSPRDEWDDFWSNPAGREEYRVPQGTIMCKWVIPLEVENGW